MKSLTNPVDRSAILQRLARVRPDTPRQWGRMTAPQMICHLTDAFRGVMGERQPSSSALPGLPRWRQRLMKLIALQLPLRWPHGVRTPAAADQERGGTPPREFDEDMANLLQVLHRFSTERRGMTPHFLFGPLTDEECGRWGYRHMDHHLRQFGA